MGAALAQLDSTARPQQTAQGPGPRPPVGMAVEAPPRAETPADDAPETRDGVGTLKLEILKDTSPELAIKIAYDFARGLNIKGADDSELPHLLDAWVTKPYRENPLYPYLAAGFIAGFHGGPLPWKRQIDERPE